MTSTAWFKLCGLLSAEAGIVLLIAGSAARFANPVWQRTVWHAAMTVLLGLLAMEACGIGSAILSACHSSHASDVSRRVAVQIFPVRPKMQTTDLPVNSLSARPPIARPPEAPVWWPGAVWLAGIALFLARPLGSWLGFFLLRKHRQAVKNQELLSRVDTLARRLGLSARLRLSECQHIQGPIAFGILRRAICLPAKFAETFNARQQEAMLVHELEHLRNFDPAWYLLTEITAAFWWWHPLVWWARRNLQAATEQAADEASLLVEDGPGLLAECLVQIGKSFTRSATFNLLGIEGNGFRSGLGRRVARLLKMQPEMRGKDTQGWRSVVIYSVSFAALLLLTIASASVGSIAGAQRPSLAQAIINSRQGQNQRAIDRHESALQFTGAEQGQAGPRETAPAEPDSPNAFSSKVTDPESALKKRYFKVDPNTFAQNLAKKLGKSEPGKIGAVTNVASQFVAFLSSLGIDLGSPRNIYFNETQGMLMVRATLQDLDYMEEVVQELNQSPPQLVIECKFVEFSYANPPPWFKGQWTNQNGFVQPANKPSTNLAGPEIISILTPPQTREIFRDLQALSGCDLLAAPRVTTLSGREAQIKVVEVTPFPVYPDDQSQKDRTPRFQQLELGPAINLMPMVAADGVTISMTIVPSILEFLGYETGAKSKIAQPAPMFRFRKAQTRVVLWDGQTALIGLGAVESKEKTRQRDRRVYRAVFVTAAIIDPAGNTVHPEDQLPFRNDSVPPQR